MTHRLIRMKNESSWSHFLFLRMIRGLHETQGSLHRLQRYDLSCSSPIYRKSQKKGGGIDDHHWGGTRNARVPPRFVRLSLIPKSLGWWGPKGLASRLKVALTDHLLLLTFRLIVRLNLKKSDYKSKFIFIQKLTHSEFVNGFLNQVFNEFELNFQGKF